MNDKQPVPEASAGGFSHRAKEVCFEAIRADRQRHIQQSAGESRRGEVFLGKQDFRALLERAQE